MRRFLLISAAVLLLLALTNPGLDKHQDEVAAFAEEIMREQGQRMGGDLGAELAAAALGMLKVEPYVRRLVERDSYGVLSITTLPDPRTGKRQAVGLGIAGQVFLARETIRQEVDAFVEKESGGFFRPGR